jgi:predicted Zn finger-like uncharacterized protein
VIVTCESCSTQFQLDDAKIPESGLQVQCSRCEHVFSVGPDACPDADSPEDLAVDALLSSSRTDFETDGGALLPEDIGAEGESDWEFNVDGVVADSLGQEELTDDSDAAASELSIAEHAVDDLLADIEDDVSLDVDALDDVGMEAEDLLGGLELEESGWEIAEAGYVGEIREIAREPAANISEELGDPENWDILDEPSDTRDEPVPSASVAQTFAPSGEAPNADVGAHVEPAVEISVALETGDSKLPRWTVRAREVAGWTIVSVLLLIGLYGGLASRSDAVQSGAGHWTGGGFEVDRIEGRWVDNSVAGPIYVVSGRLRRLAGSATPSGTRLEIRLVDARGRTLDWGPASLGPEIPNRLLRESNPSELDSRQSSRAAGLAVGAANWRPFEAVLAALPDSADRFELEVSGVPVR